MAFLDKLCIKGIRSFDPNSDACGTLLFQKPLTIIVGPNGTGKTTIVESLKYATTGETPPGARGVQANALFVHDPKVAHSDVRASVKLYFKDAAGKGTTVTRKLKSSVMPNGKIKCVSEGVTIARTDEKTGRHVSVDSKINDLNEEVMISMGVSKSVLSNVVFCHQEEANWPLGEPKALKEKFDDIFAATKYTKLLKSIQDLRKSQTVDVKMMAAELKHLKLHKNSAAEFNRRKEEKEAELAEKNAIVEEVRSRMEPLNDKMQRLNERTAEMQGIHTRIATMKKEEELERKKVDKLKGSILTPFRGTVEELEEELIHFDTESRRSRHSVASVEVKIESLNSDLNRCAKNRSVLVQKMGSLEADATAQGNRVEKRDGRIRTLVSEHSLPGFDRTALKGVSVRRFEDVFEKKIVEESAKLEDNKKSCEIREAELQKEIDQTRANQGSIQESVRMNKQHAEATDKEIEDINKEITEVKESQNRLSHLEQKQRSLRRSLEEKKSDFDEESFKRDIDVLKEDRSAADAKMRKLHSEMRQAQQECDKRASLGNMKTNRENKQAESKRLLDRHKSALVEFFGLVPTENLKDSVDSKRCDVEADRQQAEEERRKTENELSGLEQLFKSTTEHLKQKEADFLSSQRAIAKTIGEDGLEEKITEVEKELEKLRNEKGAVDGGKYITAKYVQELKKRDPCCPLCTRKFQKEQEVKELIKNLQGKVEKFPKESERLAKNIGHKEERRSILLELRPVSKLLVEAKAEIPALKSKCLDQESSINSLKRRNEEEKRRIETLRTEEQKLKDMENDIAFVEKYREEIKELNREIDWAEAEMWEGTRSLGSIQEDMDVQQETMDNLNARLETKQERLSKYREDVEDLNSKLNQTEREQLDIRGKMQKHQHSEQLIRDLKSRAQNFRSEAASKERQIRPLQQKLLRLTEELNASVLQKEASTRSSMEKISAMKQELKDVRNLNAEIQAYVAKGKEQEIVTVKLQLDEIDAELQDIDARKRREESRKQEMEDAEKHREVRKRELTDSLDLIKTEESLAKLVIDMEKQQDKIGDFDPTLMERQRRKMNDEIRELSKEQSRAEGEAVKLDDELKRIQKDLELDQYKDADVKYRNQLIDKVTADQANLDLLKYYKVMDKAIMLYHSSKMEEINQTLQKLWHSVYRGYDIDSIRIVSEDDYGASSDIRKVYNYRVVMDKRGVNMDMRGRCSAGQKVLASILIRVALAAVFCLDCGVLTLDEPTTNLDSENMIYLAKALGTLLSNRQEQQNFQLVLISHDEEFLRHLWDECRPDFFYSVEKSPDGYSQLKRHKDFDEIRH